MSGPPSVADAYSGTGGAWEAGPGLIYNRLAGVLLDACPVDVSGRFLLDVGAGTGAATRAAVARGASVCALDFAAGMLTYDRGARPPAVVGDAMVLPFRDSVVDVVVASFAYNHLADPEAGLREAARVVRSDGVMVASAYAEDDAHPARDATETALAVVGWSMPEAYATMKREAMPRLATVARAEAVARAAGWAHVDARVHRVGFPELSTADLVRWRLGMAYTAPFFGSLSVPEQRRVIDDVATRLDGAPVLVRSMVVVRGWRRR